MIKKYISKLQKDGFIIIDNIFNKKQTNLVKKKLDIILKNRIKKNMIVGDEDNQIMYNYFFDDKSLLKLLYIPLVDQILKSVLDNNYVLSLGNAQNRVTNIYNIKRKKKNYKIGSTWHTDSRYLGKKRISKGFSYLLIIALDPFTKENGATKFIPKSVNSSSIPPRKIKNKSKKYHIKNLVMKEGSICIMDSGIWHKAGKSSNLSRWSIFNLYTGWFVKPYFDYKKLTKQNIKKIYKKLLHGYADPPKINGNRLNTVVKY
jgi:hypothetical protein